MVIVKGSFPVKKRLRGEALALVESFSANSRAEAGCLASEVYFRVDDPATLMVWQQWRSSATLQSHFSSDSVEAFLDRLVHLLDGKVDTLYFDVQNDEVENASTGIVAATSCVADGVTRH
jgi:quinol monooxygenase YgiN